MKLFGRFILSFVAAVAVGLMLVAVSGEPHLHIIYQGTVGTVTLVGGFLLALLVRSLLVRLSDTPSHIAASGMFANGLFSAVTVISATSFEHGADVDPIWVFVIANTFGGLVWCALEYAANRRQATAE